MCGINGFLWKDEKIIAAMNAATEHRGPDGTRTYTEEGISLGQNRLAIIDLKDSASQPLASYDKRFVIVFNGEIYNFKELKKELPDYPFRTEGDTEVILAAYATWGTACFARLRGMFALAIWDRQKRELIIARDAVGIKPFYYFWDGKKFMFSSELSALTPHVNSVLNKTAFATYFSLLYVPGPETFIKNIFKLSAASYGVVSVGTFTLSTYTPQVAVPKDFTSTTVRSVISESVKSQLVSDRPVGVFLSGGFDSSIVLHHVMEHAGRAETFTTGFELPTQAKEETEKFNSDMVLAKKTAALYGTTHHEHIISLETVRNTFEEVVGAIDDPVANSALLPTYHLSKFAKEHVAVVLDGSGGDELFGGYNWYKISRLADYFKMFPTPLQRMVEPLHPILTKIRKKDAEYYLAFMGQEKEVLNRMLKSTTSNEDAHQYITEQYFTTPDTMTITAKMMHIDEHMWLVDESLMRSDKMGMAQGLELRVPLLDDTVVALAHSIPGHKKVSPLTTKKILREAYRGHLPEHLYNEPKRGWFPPGAKWIRDPGMREMLASILSPEYYAPTNDLFDWPEITRVFEAHADKKGYYFKPIWAVVTFQIWARRNKVRLS